MGNRPKRNDVQRQIITALATEAFSQIHNQLKSEMKSNQIKASQVKSTQSMGWTYQMINDFINLTQVDRRKKIARKYFCAHTFSMCMWHDRECV